MLFLKNIHIHPFFWLVAAMAIVTARFYDLLMLFIIVFIHELGHAVAAFSFSWRIRKIILLPFGGVLELDEHGNRPVKEELIVTIAGPIQHLFLIMIAKLLESASLITETTYTVFVEYNVMIFLFNCLPILPLDGGKLIYLFYSHIFPFVEALKKAIITSFICLCCFVLAVLKIMPFHLNSWVIVIFLFLSLRKEWKNRHFVFMRFLMERQFSDNKKKGTIITVHENDSVMTVFHQFFRGREHFIRLRTRENQEKQINEKQLLQTFFDKKSYVISMKELF